MNCREFKSKHVGFIDDVLCAADMAAMRRHIGVCARCSTLDIRIRRSLMVVRNLPQVELSSDFYPRLIERLQHAPAPSANQRASSVATTVVVVTAALAAAVYFAMAVGVHRIPATSPRSGRRHRLRRVIVPDAGAHVDQQSRARANRGRWRASLAGDVHGRRAADASRERRFAREQPGTVTASVIRFVSYSGSVVRFVGNATGSFGWRLPFAFPEQPTNRSE